MLIKLIARTCLSVVETKITWLAKCLSLNRQFSDYCKYAFCIMEAPLARSPVFSHSNARALYDRERNNTDDQIRAMGARGGYVGVNGVGFFLGVPGPAIPETMARHAAHVASLIGADRVGLGLDFMFLDTSDYDFFHAARGRWPRGYPDPPWDFLQPEQPGDLVAALERVGFRRDELARVLGGNYLRLAGLWR